MKGGRENGGGITGRWPFTSCAFRASFAPTCWAILGIGKGKVNCGGGGMKGGGWAWAGGAIFAAAFK